LQDASATRASILASLQKLTREAESAEGNPVDLIFYFNGHGVQIDGLAYLVPYDIAAGSAQAAISTAVSIEAVGSVLDRITSARRLIFLDISTPDTLGRDAR
jgi:uncharacterized caspase-like protein